MGAASSTEKVSIKQLREFGFTMAGALVLLGSIFYWSGKHNAIILVEVGCLFLILGLIAPRVLTPLEKVWMAFSRIVSKVLTPIVFTLVFMIVFAPVGVMLRILRVDLLKRKLEPEAATYWVPVEDDAPGTRPFAPY